MLVPAVGVGRLLVDDLHAVVPVLRRLHALAGKALASGEGVREGAVLAVAALVALEGIEVLVVDVAALAALVRVLVAVAADAVLVVHSARAARALQALSRHGLDVLVEVRVLDEEVGRCDRDREVHLQLGLAPLQLAALHLLPGCPVATQLHDVLHRLVVAVQVDHADHAGGPHVRRVDGDALDGVARSELHQHRGVRELGLCAERGQLTAGVRHLRVVADQAGLALQVVAVEVDEAGERAVEVRVGVVAEQQVLVHKGVLQSLEHGAERLLNVGRSYVLGDVRYDEGKESHELCCVLAVAGQSRHLRSQNVERSLPLRGATGGPQPPEDVVRLLADGHRVVLDKEHVDQPRKRPVVEQALDGGRCSGRNSGLLSHGDVLVGGLGILALARLLLLALRLLHLPRLDLLVGKESQSNQLQSKDGRLLVEVEHRVQEELEEVGALCDERLPVLGPALRGLPRGLQLLHEEHDVCVGHLQAEAVALFRQPAQLLLLRGEHAGVAYPVVLSGRAAERSQEELGVLGLDALVGAEDDRAQHVGPLLLALSSKGSGLVHVAGEAQDGVEQLHFNGVEERRLALGKGLREEREDALAGRASTGPEELATSSVELLRALEVACGKASDEAFA
mmetsp:Transcript_18307/g.70732  ORF Transcript_18307/g.70732 Transcript_18307/m.70732 type:complete len:624 (-) Transcript_18307:704-2575(-)